MLTRAQDPTVNRLEDSILLWKSVVSNKLLANVNIVLFLNKCDLLQRKLAAGVRLAHYMTSYGDRANDFDSVSKCASRAMRCGPGRRRAAPDVHPEQGARAVQCVLRARVLARVLTPGRSPHDRRRRLAQDEHPHQSRYARPPNPLLVRRR
jgi:hypothetical protein